MFLIAYIIIGIFCGVLATLIFASNDFIKYVIVGVLGALIGGLISDLVGFSFQGRLGSLLICLISSILLLLLMLFTRPRLANNRRSPKY